MPDWAEIKKDHCAWRNDENLAFFPPRHGNMVNWRCEHDLRPDPTCGIAAVACRSTGSTSSSRPRSLSCTRAPTRWSQLNARKGCGRRPAVLRFVRTCRWRWTMPVAMPREWRRSGQVFLPWAISRRMVRWRGESTEVTFPSGLVKTFVRVSASLPSHAEAFEDSYPS
jgi:hypothetical protein